MNCVHNSLGGMFNCSSICFGEHLPHHAMSQATQGQLIFRRDMVLSIEYQMDWNMATQRKQNKTESMTPIEAKTNSRSPIPMLREIK